VASSSTHSLQRQRSESKNTRHSSRNPLYSTSTRNSEDTSTLNSSTQRGLHTRHQTLQGHCAERDSNSSRNSHNFTQPTPSTRRLDSRTRPNEALSIIFGPLMPHPKSNHPKQRDTMVRSASCSEFIITTTTQRQRIYCT